MQANDPPRRLGFGVFGVDLRDRQLTKRGLRIRLQEQPFQVLAMLLERPGEVVTRDELRNRLWPKATLHGPYSLLCTAPPLRHLNIQEEVIHLDCCALSDLAFVACTLG